MELYCDYARKGIFMAYTGKFSPAPISVYIANIKKGDRVKGVPNGYADFGVFVTLASGVRGLVPKGFISKDLSANAAEVLSIGVEQEFTVQHIDTNSKKSKITLSTTEFELDSDDCVVYDEDYQYFDKYGYLYSEKSLEEAIPEGWHLPTKKESRCKDVLSVIASDEWIDSSSDKYGFSMVLGGRHDDNDDFELIDFSAHFWCVEKTVDPISLAIGCEKFYTCVRFEDGCDEIDDEDYTAYASIRLVKDAE